MVIMLVSSAVVRGLKYAWVKPKTIKLEFVASHLSMQHLRVRTKTGWLGTKIKFVVELHGYPWIVVSVT